MLGSLRPTAAGAATNLGVCILAGCALIAAATWAGADSTARRQSRGTHVGVAPNDLVTLSSTGTGSNLKFVRANPDGTIAASEFQVPTGMRLVVTDVDWAGSASTSSPTNVLRVFVENRTTTTTRSIVHVLWGIHGAVSGSGGSYPAGGTNGVVTGFSVSSGGRLTADVMAASAAVPTQSFPATTSTILVLLRGYLTPEE